MAASGFIDIESKLAWAGEKEKSYWAVSHKSKQRVADGSVALPGAGDNLGVLTIGPVHLVAIPLLNMFQTPVGALICSSANCTDSDCPKRISDYSPIRLNLT